MKDYEVKDRILEFMRESPEKFLNAGNIAATFNEEDDVDIHKVNAFLAEMRRYGFVEWVHRRNPHINKITSIGITFIRDRGGYTEHNIREVNRIAKEEVEREREKRQEMRWKKWDRARDWVFGGMILILSVLQILQIAGVI